MQFLQYHLQNFQDAGKRVNWWNKRRWL